MELKTELVEEIDALIPKYPEKRSAVLMLLHKVQEDQGYISPEAVQWIAEKLELQPINVQELVTFYPMLRQEPIGKVHVKVCRTLPCALNGAYATCEKLQSELNCKLGGTSPDGNFTIEFVECIASCGTGPVVHVDETMHENIRPENATELADQLKAQVKSS